YQGCTVDLPQQEWIPGLRQLGRLGPALAHEPPTIIFPWSTALACTRRDNIDRDQPGPRTPPPRLHRRCRTTDDHRFLESGGTGTRAGHTCPARVHGRV